MSFTVCVLMRVCVCVWEEVLVVDMEMQMKVSLWVFFEECLGSMEYQAHCYRPVNHCTTGPRVWFALLVKCQTDSLCDAGHHQGCPML